MRKLRAFSLPVVGILVWALVFAGCSGSSSTTITLAPASGQTLSPGSTLTITAAVANDKTNEGVTWSLSGPGSLSGSTTTSVVYTAPSSISTTATATITATSVAKSSVTSSESITLNAVLTITTTSLPAGTLLVPYNAFVNASGATGTFTWTVTSGSLPPGLNFLTTSTSSSAEITGTPTVLGTYKFSVQVTDAAGASVTQALSITINSPPPLSVATGSLPNGTVNVAYNQTLQASSGIQPYSWSLTSGSLPVGLALNSSNGAISGTPIATGTSNFTVQVKDSSVPQQSASANLSITIQAGVTQNSKLSGNYAFSVRGFDTSGLFVAAGSFVADGNGNISSGIMDLNNTVMPANETFNGTYSIDQSGLGFMTFNIAGGGSRSFALSVMADGNANIIEFDDSTGGFSNNSSRNSGVLLKQTTSAFTTASINGGYAFGFLGIDSSRNRFGVAGAVQATGATGTFSNGFLDSDDAGSLSSNIGPFGGAYSVATTGRGTATIGAGNYSFYVVNSTELLVIGIDPFVPGGNPLVSGTMLQQSNTGFTVSSLNAASVFEVAGLEASAAESQIGIFNGHGDGTFSLASDQNTAGALTSPSGTGNYTVAPNGRTTLTVLTGSGFQNSQPVLYLVTPNQAFVVGTDSAVSFGLMTPQQSGFTLSGTYAGGSLSTVDVNGSNVVSIAIAGTSNFGITADVSNASGLSQNQASEGITSGQGSRVVLTENGITVDILYLVSSSEFFALSADPSARLDIFQQ